MAPAIPQLSFYTPRGPPLRPPAPLIPSSCNRCRSHLPSHRAPEVTKAMLVAPPGPLDPWQLQPLPKPPAVPSRTQGDESHTSGISRPPSPLTLLTPALLPSPTPCPCRCRFPTSPPTRPAAFLLCLCRRHRSCIRTQRNECQISMLQPANPPTSNLLILPRSLLLPRPHCCRRRLLLLDPIRLGVSIPQPLHPVRPGGVPPAISKGGQLPGGSLGQQARLVIVSKGDGGVGVEDVTQLAAEKFLLIGQGTDA